MKLVTKGHDGLDDGARKDRIACESFIKGLRQEIKETVWEKCPNTFQEAVQAAERREVFLNSVEKRSRVNEVSEDMIGLIQKFNKDGIKSNQEIWKAIQGLTTAVQALAKQAKSRVSQTVHVLTHANAEPKSQKSPNHVLLLPSTWTCEKKLPSKTTTSQCSNK